MRHGESTPGAVPGDGEDCRRAGDGDGDGRRRAGDGDGRRAGDGPAPARPALVGDGEQSSVRLGGGRGILGGIFGLFEASDARLPARTTGASVSARARKRCNNKRELEPGPRAGPALRTHARSRAPLYANTAGTGGVRGPSAYRFAVVAGSVCARLCCIARAKAPSSERF